MPRFLLRLSPAIIFSGNLFLLFGCSVSGPEYHKPEPQAPAAFKGTTSTAATVTSPKVGNGTWWQVFNDSALNQLESAALSANPQIAGAIARIDEARARLGLAAADRQPTLSTTSTAQLLNETVGKDTAAAPTTIPLPITGRQLPRSLLMSPTRWICGDAYAAVRVGRGAGRSLRTRSRRCAANPVCRCCPSLVQPPGPRRGDRCAAPCPRPAARTSFSQRQRAQAGLTAELDLQRSKVELAGAEAELADVSRRRRNRPCPRLVDRQGTLRFHTALVRGPR